MYALPAIAAMELVNAIPPRPRAFMGCPSR